MSLKGFNHPMHSYNENSITGFEIAEHAHIPTQHIPNKNGLNQAGNVEKPTLRGYGRKPHDTSMPQPPQGN